jgi:Cadherin domain
LIKSIKNTSIIVLIRIFGAPNQDFTLLGLFSGSNSALARMDSDFHITSEPRLLEIRFVISLTEIFINSALVSYFSLVSFFQVTDTNDNPPLFTEPAYSFDIPENAPRGYQVGLISATDRDLGANSMLTYTVISDWANDVFSLNPQTGVFTLTARLDYEEVSNSCSALLLEVGKRNSSKADNHSIE